MTALGVLRHPLGLLLPTGAGAATALVLASSPPRLGLAALGVLVAVPALVLWPWAALPVTIVGGVVVAQALGLNRVGPVVAVHVVLAALGFLGVVIRRAVNPLWGHRVATRADLPMLAFAAAVLLGALYGLAVGNPEYRVLVAAYELGVIPLYFFLATLTLTSPRHLRSAALLFAAGVIGMVLMDWGAEGRHGGLLAALALPPALAAASEARRLWGRAALLGASVLFALDVVLSSYRTVWVAAGVSVVLLALFGGARVRLAAAVAAALALVTALALALAAPDGVDARTELLAETIYQPSGYRLEEARIGWEVLLLNPLVGQGLGQAESDVFVPGFGVVDVGPVYHAFYVTLLANLGLVGLALFAWPLVVALRESAGLRGQPLAFGALLAGWIIAAVFAGPTDGHWELGLLAALALVATRFRRLWILR